MTRSFPLTLALCLTLVACGGGSDGSGSDGSGFDGSGFDGSGSDGGGSDGGGSDGSGSGGGGGPDGQANVDDPSTGYDYFVAFGYRACELYEECTPAEAAYLSYDQCIEQVDTAAAYYDLAFADCSFDAGTAEQCWQNMIDASCEEYDGGETECDDDAIWQCP